MAEKDTRTEEQRRKDWKKQDREVERITQTVRPHSDAPSRANITGPGSGADGGSGHHEK